MFEPIRFKLIDAFARTPYSGNVAAVVLDADGLTDRQMRLVAAEFNASETTFVLRPDTRDAAVRFRWFTPGCEVDFCGHATLAAVHALLEEGRFTHTLDRPGTILPIETRSGILTVRTERREAEPPPPEGGIEGDASPAASNPPITLWLDMPRCQPKNTHVILPSLLKHLGLDEELMDPAIPPIRTHDDDVILAVHSLSALLELQPEMSSLARSCRKERIRGVLVTTTNVLTSATVVQSRFFAPAVGIDEDPVTGSVHGPLGLHLVNSGVIPMVNGLSDFHCAQARAGGRAGLVRIVVTQDDKDGKHVRIGGVCITTAGGVLQRLPVDSEPFPVES
ncbi:MAG: PhzF family phenazine biosynthesis protein [Phycisphaerae bacterium]